MVKVKPTNTQNKITVKTSVETNTYSVKDSMSEYYAKLAERWANSPELIEGIDYSSKHYANKSKEFANESEQHKDLALNAIASFDNKVIEAQENIEQSRLTALQSVSSTYAIGKEDFEQFMDESIAEYTQIANQIKQDNSESSQLSQDWAISEVIVDNLDYSAKYWAEKAKDNSGIFYDELANEDIDVEIVSGGYVTKADLELGLDTKQDKGDYALKTDLNNLATKSEIPTQVSELTNDSNYATQTQVMQAIASIPQFKLSIVKALPTTGAKMTLYLVPKTGADNDVYDEYIWIEQTSSFEHLGTTAVDLTGYVKNTDYAGDNAGVVKVSSANGLRVYSNGYIAGFETTLKKYETFSNSFVICKGTLNTILNQYKKVSEPMTEDAYNALATKDSNTLYLIEE